MPQAAQALDRFKQEVASELGIQNYQGYLGDLPSRLNGAVGGHMVRRMIAAAEQSLIEQATQQVRAGFQQGFQSAGSVPEHESPDRADADASPAERVTHRTSAAVGGCRRGRSGPPWVRPCPPFKGRTGGFGEVSLGRTLTGEEDLPAMQLLDYAGFRDRLAEAFFFGGEIPSPFG